ncbi:hypothetical protein N7520_007548 [Penicillium odoratum]|uniref:uncharacterized protein n=1 Tax=Penicillium odoratum TaxID=1167516 RepID=UPI002546DC3C|nr:uncharacterized protein N7520_007548 [Penicillium odoratum]KAJ5760392.1 hypothetical protein N7520_007548 [Penicillium odoratum]
MNPQGQNNTGPVGNGSQRYQPVASQSNDPQNTALRPVDSQSNGRQNNGSTGSARAQRSAFNNSQMHYDPRTSHYQKSASVSIRDGSGRTLNLPYRPRNDSNATAVSMNSMDFNQNPYSSPYMMVPSSGVIGAVSQGPTFVSTQRDQMAPFQYFYPNMPPQIVPSGYPPWPYLVNYDAQNRQAWGSVDGQNGSQAETGHTISYYPPGFAPSGSGIPGYQYGPVISNPAQGPLNNMQLMRTKNGYEMTNLLAIVQQEPAIPRAVPAMWTNPSEMTLAKCLENREGITNVYIRGFLPETTDELLSSYAARFGEIERCKAIVDLETGLCKGFGFVQYHHLESCENAVRGFFWLGYQASFAQKSRNSRLKDLEDRSSTNLYCTNLPSGWMEADLRRHFEPYNVVSEKISRDDTTGMSREVGFARFESRAIAEKVLSEFHNIPSASGVKLLLRFADTKAQKVLKQQSNDRRAYRAGEYNYSVEMFNGSTPSPTLKRTQNSGNISHLTPTSALSFSSPAEVGSNWTPASSMSSTGVLKRVPTNVRPGLSSSTRSLNGLENTPVRRRPFLGRRSLTDVSGLSSKTVVPSSSGAKPLSYKSSSQKENIKAGSISPSPSFMESDVEYRESDMESEMECPISSARSCT